jgi:hypothetical protein
MRHRGASSTGGDAKQFGYKKILASRSTSPEFRWTFLWNI